MSLTTIHTDLEHDAICPIEEVTLSVNDCASPTFPALCRPTVVDTTAGAPDAYISSFRLQLKSDQPSVDRGKVHFGLVQLIFGGKANLPNDAIRPVQSCRERQHYT